MHLQKHYNYNTTINQRLIYYVFIPPGLNCMSYTQNKNLLEARKFDTIFNHWLIFYNFHRIN